MTFATDTIAARYPDFVDRVDSILATPGIVELRVCPSGYLAFGYSATLVIHTCGAVPPPIHPSVELIFGTAGDMDATVLRSVILSLAKHRRPIWARDAAFVGAAVFEMTKVRLRSLRDFDTARAVIAPESTEDLPMSELLARSTPVTRQLAKEEQTQASIWHWASYRGHRVDRVALAGAKDEVRAAREAGLQRNAGIDLMDSARPEPIFRWLDARGIRIVDERGKRKLSHDYWAAAVVPEASLPDWEAFKATRNAGANSAKLNEIERAMTAEGRVHTTFSTMGAITGRFTSTNPALQNLPKGLHRLLIADPGMQLVSADLKFCEIAVAAMLSGDPDLVVACAGDPYVDLAVKIWGPQARDDISMRSRAKRGLLAPMYGQGAEGLGRQLQIPTDRARDLIHGVHSSYPVFSRWMADTEAQARSGRPLHTMRGRQLPAPDAPYKSVNHVIQASAAELWKVMVLRVAKRLGPASCWLPVHDDLVVSVPDDLFSLKQAVAVLQEEMCESAKGVELKVGLPTRHGDRWGV